jgi:hypothetical protein
MDEERSRETRARAELGLLRLIHELRDEDACLVVLGGLVPEAAEQLLNGPFADELPARFCEALGV